jgi:hypothetical protein
MTDYLQRELKSEYELRYFILDRTQFDGNFREIGDYVPEELGGEPGGGTILKSLIHIDSLGLNDTWLTPIRKPAGDRRPIEAFEPLLQAQP